VEEGHIFFHLLKFIMNTLPALENNGEVIVFFPPFISPLLPSDQVV
jgi:hypothetical protein